MARPHGHFDRRPHPRLRDQNQKGDLFLPHHGQSSEGGGCIIVVAVVDVVVVVVVVIVVVVIVAVVVVIVIVVVNVKVMAALWPCYNRDFLVDEFLTCL